MRSWILGPALALAQILAMTAAGAHAEMRTCTQKEYDTASSVGWNDNEGHALFQVPPIVYDRPKTSVIGFQMVFVVATDGHIVCLDRADEILKALDETPERRALIPQIEGWRFKSFLDKGKPVQSLATVYLDEKIDFHFHEDMPAAPASDVTVKLSRSGCYGRCPSYSVFLRGSGWVEFDGDWYTAVRGKHVYTVDPAKVAALMADMRTNDVWSMAGNWVAEGFDAPRYDMDLTIGGAHRHFADFFGRQRGMPQAVNDFMNEVDTVSRADDFIHLSSFAVQHLEDEGFDFHSQKAADLFFEAVNDDEVTDAPLLRLIALGVPVMAGRTDKVSYMWPTNPPLVAALRNRHTGLIPPLISMGALNTAGKPDQAKIEAAFQAAIAGGRMAAVQQMWQQAGARPHPSLFTAEKGDDGKTRRYPVTLLLARDESDHNWEGLAIAKWLIALGCDIRAHDANGKTLLDIAAEADDIPMVKYLLAQGIDADASGSYGDSALGAVQDDEGMAMLLIEAGADPWKLETSDYSFRSYAKEKGWIRVLTWMDAHKPQGQGAPVPKP